MNGNQNEDKHKPRDYQIELYKAAKDQNTIVCSGTGTGKTFIAILLINDPQFAKQLRGNYSEDAKRTMFLVPTRPLVKQQSEAIRRHFNGNVGEYTGDKNVDDWDQNKWNEELEQNVILVMTAQIFCDMLRKGFISFKKVNLLIMDEIHWATNTKANKQTGHPYKEIMNFYSEVTENRPRVLGLTASLINCLIKPNFFDEAVNDLKKTVGNAICLTSSAAELCATNPIEKVIEYNNNSFAHFEKTANLFKSLDILFNYFKDSLKESENKKISLGFGTIKKCLTNIMNMFPQTKESPTMSWMGIWCANVAIDYYIKEYKLYRKIYSHINPINAKVCGHVITMFKVIKTELKPQLNDTNCALNTASPKMHLMLKLLNEYKPKTNEKSKLCAIIFVNQRSVAKVLTKWLKALKKLRPDLYDFLNVGYVVGHSSRPGIESTIASFSDRKQQKTIDKFRDEELNLLVATSVLEEGLDVRKCNLVIRFDAPKTFREYLQSKGRARAKDAFYYMFTSNKGKLNDNLKTYKIFEEKIKNMSNDIDLHSSDSESDSSDEEQELRDNETNAKLSTRNSVSLLYRYCQSLPSDSFTRFEPIFKVISSNGRFRYSVKLPIICPINTTVFGDYKRKKIYAKRNAAFKTCVELYEINELDKRFIPLSQEQSIEKYIEDLGFSRHLTDDKEEYKRTGTKNNKRNYKKKWSQVFSENNDKSNKYYLHRISLQNEVIQSLTSEPMSFGILTNEPIINSCFTIFAKTGEISVKLTHSNAIEINSQQKSSIESFHNFTISKALRLENNEIEFSPKDTKFFLLIVPISDQMKIDWNFIELISDQNVIEMKDIDKHDFEFKPELYKDCVFSPLYRNEENPPFYKAIKITDKTPNSAFNEMKKYKTFKDYYSDKYGIKIFNDKQLLIEGKQVENFAQLNSYVIKKKTQKMMDKMQFFVPELIEIHPFKYSLMIQALCLPAILYRLNYLLLTEELRKSITFKTGIKTMNSLSLNTIEKSKQSKRVETDIDIDSNEPLPKKFCENSYSIQIPEKISEEEEDSDSSYDSSDSNASIDTNDLSEKIETLIEKFDLFIKEAKEYSVAHHRNDRILEEMNSEKIEEIIREKPPAYGESFPFIFNGIIDENEIIKYDSTGNDVMSGPTADQLLCALTLVNANDCFNLERLETIGDSFLKFVTTVYSFFECSQLDEGRLTDLRALQISNRNLYYIGIKKRIEQLLVATKFEPKNNWLPPSYKTSEDNNRAQQSISDKSIADSIEALIGAHLLNGGNSCAIDFMEWLGLKVNPKKKKGDWGSYKWCATESPIRKHLSPDSEEVVNGLTELYEDCNLAQFEKIIGYNFNDKALLVQAFTHSSYFLNEITGCYQRLEFMGDSVLDYLISRHIFKDSNKFSPSEITDLRSALVNNSFFASIAVKFQFHKYLKNLSFDLFRAIDYFVRKFDENKIKTIKNCFSLMNETEVNSIEEIEVPKALGDIFESVAGAVYLDNGLSLDGVWNVFYKMLKPEIDYFSQNIPMMSVRELREKVPEVEFSNAEPVEGRKIRICVTVNGKEFSGIGISKKYAKISASKSALKYIKSIKSSV